MKISFHRIHKISMKLRTDHVAAYAGQTAYCTILSCLPFLMFLLTLIQYLPIDLSTILSLLFYVVPETYESIIRSVFMDIHAIPGTALLSISLIITIWTAAKATLAISNGLNSVYEYNETRNYFELRFKAMICTFLFGLVIIFTVLVLVFGNRIYSLLHRGFVYFPEPVLFLTIIRLILSFIIFFLFFLFFYTILPSKRTSPSCQLPGAFFSTLMWMISSYIFSLYVDSNPMNSFMYGSLTYIILFLIYLYILIYLFFIGAEINYLYMTYVKDDDYY